MSIEVSLELTGVKALTIEINNAVFCFFFLKKKSLVCMNRLIISQFRSRQVDHGCAFQWKRDACNSNLYSGFWVYRRPIHPITAQKLL